MATINIVDLWNVFRGFENAFRYYSDIIGSIIPLVPEHNDYTINHLDPKKIDEIKSLWPNICIPPRCFKTPEDLAREVEGLARRSAALADVTRVLADQIMRQDPPIKNIEHYASELPGTRWVRGGPEGGEQSR